jgi:hypothetical protein
MVVATAWVRWCWQILASSNNIIQFSILVGRFVYLLTSQFRSPFVDVGLAASPCSSSWQCSLQVPRRHHQNCCWSQLLLNTAQTPWEMIEFNQKNKKTKSSPQEAFISPFVARTSITKHTHKQRKQNLHV